MNQLPCIATMQVDAYLQQLDDAEEEAQWIDDRVSELLATPEYSPWSASNFAEAMWEMDPEKLGQIVTLLASGDPKDAVQALRNAAFEYWDQEAERAARLEYRANPDA